MKKERIGLWGKHEQMTSLLERELVRMGYPVCRVESEQALETVRAPHQPDLVFLDHLHGCEILRQHRYARPIVFYSSQDDPRSKALALDRGADDYIVVPFARAEFAARLRALFRRASYASLSQAQQTLAEQTVFQSTDGYLTLNVATHRVFIDQREVHLTKTEFDLLHCFLQHVGHVLSADFLLEAVWGPDAQGARELVRVYIRNVRQKIEPAPTKPQYIQTRFQQGYVFATPSEA